VPLSDVLVTGVRPVVTGAAASDPAGFFVQAVAAGPAIFVEVDPATLMPSPRKGDRLRFVAIAAGRAATNSFNPLAVTALAGFERTGWGHSTDSLVQDISTIDFSSTANVDALESELVTVTGTLATNVSFGGSGFVVANLATPGTTGLNGAIKLRVPNALAATEDLAAGCLVTVTSPLWRYSSTAQPSAFSLSELTVLSCPPPRLVAVSATTANTVVATFDRSLLSLTITTGAFSIAGLTITSVTHSGGREVSLGTSTQVANTNYTLAVAGVRDLRGAPVAAGTSGTFGGYAPCGPVLSQVYIGGGLSQSVYNARFVELHNRSGSPISLSNYSLQYASATATTGSWVTGQLGGTLAPGGYFLVQLGLVGSVGASLMPDLVLASPQPSSLAGKLALVQGSTVLTGQCPAGVVDLLGYGWSNCSWGDPAPQVGQLEALSRGGAGCQHTGANASDFTVVTPAPRNSSTASALCACP
jgi:hypothetical protein